MQHNKSAIFNKSALGQLVHAPQSAISLLANSKIVPAPVPVPVPTAEKSHNRTARKVHNRRLKIIHTNRHEACVASDDLMLLHDKIEYKLRKASANLRKKLLKQIHICRALTKTAQASAQDTQHNNKLFQDNANRAEKAQQDIRTEYMIEWCVESNLADCPDVAKNSPQQLAFQMLTNLKEHETLILNMIQLNDELIADFTVNVETRNDLVTDLQTSNEEIQLALTQNLEQYNQLVAKLEEMHDPCKDELLTNLKERYDLVTTLHNTNDEFKVEWTKKPRNAQSAYPRHAKCTG